MKAIALGILLMFATAVLPAAAVEPDEILADPVLEARARDISKNLRCLVCQNQSIDDSNAELARDLRLLVRERLVAGDSNDEVIAFVVARYGDYVLLNPPFKASTYVLWLGPAGIFLAGLGAVAVYYRRRAPGATKAPGASDTPPPALSEDEQRRFDALMKDQS
jgi:cytochrome c-type biogenesis protein CcmH